MEEQLARLAGKSKMLLRENFQALQVFVPPQRVNETSQSVLYEDVHKKNIFLLSHLRMITSQGDFQRCV